MSLVGIKLSVLLVISSDLIHQQSQAFIIIPSPSQRAVSTTPWIKSIHPSSYEGYSASAFSPDDPLQQADYWEEMFLGGAADSKKKATLRQEDEGPSNVEIISFDLDDTLWNGKTVISNANQALQDFLTSQYPLMVAEGQPTVSFLMWTLAKKFPEDYLEDQADPGSVVRFTELRKLALSVLAQKCGYDGSKVAEEAFQAWHDARHAVEDLFFPGALELLARLKAKGIRLCAITNGNCDINQISSFQGVFDFCINAEKVGARKRTGRPYIAALKAAGVNSSIGSKWVHIGDDFTEDIVAAKADLKLRTIWYHTAERKAKKEAEEQARRATKSLDSGDASADKQEEAATPSKYFQDKQAIQVSSMEIDDYLAHFITKEFADAEVETIQEIEEVISEWMDNWSQSEKAFAGISSSSAATKKVDIAAARGTTEDGGGGAQHKFCIACGEKVGR